MIYKLESTSRFKKDLKIAIKRGYDLKLLEVVVDTLLAGKKLPAKYKAHQLSGNYVNHMECHILPDWLLVYRIYEDILVLTLSRTGSHSDLFK